MRMYCSCIKTLNVEQGYRHIDQEAEDPRTNKIPEGYRNEAVYRPFQTMHPRCAVKTCIVFKGFIT